MFRGVVSGRSARALLAWTALLSAGVAALLAGSARSGHAGAAGADVARGAELYAVTCAACHGGAGQGGTGEGVAAGPPLRELDAAYVDQQMRTGRMPVVEPRLGVHGPERLPDADREAVLAWMTGAMALTGDLPDVLDGDRARGHELYQIHCAACHGSMGDGGIGADGTVILGLLGHDRLAHVEAIRVGPYDMPAFDEEQLSVQEASDIAEFVVRDLDGAPRTPLGLREMHRYTMWGMAAVVALALLGIVVLVGRPVRFPPDGGGADPEPSGGGEA